MNGNLHPLAANGQQVEDYFKRPRVEGKFIMVGDEKFFVKGVTYGTFKPDEEGDQFPPEGMIWKDFSLMAFKEINAVRTYTVPPRYLLDIAAVCGLKVMVGLPWEQHINFLDSPERIEDILDRVKMGVMKCRNHPAILGYTIGNEIPGTIVRWYGKRRIEKFLHQLYKTVKSIDPHALVTYVNYPTTEYLSLPFLDFDCFNVYLETKEKLNTYLQRLHNLTGDRPLLLAEIGLDSMRNGKDKQAEVLDWQIRTIFDKGCAGTFVFAWTDEWWRGGFDIEDWDFGLVDRDRNAKPALEAVSKAFSEIPFSGAHQFPFISVVVCTYNGGATIKDCLDGLMKIDYPAFEVIVVDDGSTDKTACLVKNYPVRLISTPNRGLSNARNTGMLEARGEIVSYIDDDAYPDPHWLKYLAFAFTSTAHAGIGGPNIAPGSDGPIARCVANAPGGPVHVLLSDEIAEHIPGCNMSFRKEVLMEIGGFDPIYRAAGDDVDLCWRIQHIGKTIGYHPSALVWHHRRNSVKAYWKQQKGYGKAEALLENKWPEKYNSFGHLSWAGRIYGHGVTLPIKMKKDKIFHGIWGSAPFQSVYQAAPSLISCIPLMPEWHLLIGILGLLSVLSISWTPLLWTLPFFFATQAVVCIQAGISAAKALSGKKFSNKIQYLKHWALITTLHVVQPIARLYGRIAHGLTPWRRRGSGSPLRQLFVKHNISMSHWSEQWKSAEGWLEEIEYNLIESRARVRRGGQYDNWDLRASCGFFSSGLGLLTIEEHGAGKQLLRFRCWPKYSATGIAVVTFLATLSVLAFADKAYTAALILGFFSVTLVFKYFTDTSRAMLDLAKAFKALSSSKAAITTPEQPTTQLNQLAAEDLNYLPKIFNGTRVILTDTLMQYLPTVADEASKVDAGAEKDGSVMVGIEVVIK